MNKTQVKRSLLASLLALVLCVAMFASTTYAWFTDTASTGINKITSGNLDVKFEYSTDFSNWNSAEAATNIFSNSKWEPGYTEVVYFKVTNAGSLAFDYVVSTNIDKETPGVNQKGESFKLSEFLKYDIITTDAKFDSREAARAAVETPNAFTAVVKDEAILKADEAITFAMVVWMPEETGDVANHNGKDIPSIDFGISVVAHQAVAEKDSYNPDYDANAPVLIIMNGNSYATLDKAIEAAKEGDVIEVTGPASFDFGTASNQTIDAKGVTVKSAPAKTRSAANTATVVFKGDGANNTISNIKLENITVVDETTSYSEDSWELGYLEMADVTAKNVVFKNGIMLDGTNSFTGCTFTGKLDSGLKMYGAWVNEGTSTFTGCTFTGTRGLKMHEAYESEIATVTVTGCTFINLSEKPGIAIGDLNADTTVSIVKCSFVNTQPGDQGNYMYETDTDTTTFKFILSENEYGFKISTAEELVAFANQVNAGNNFKGETVTLEADIDMAGVAYTPAGNVQSYPSTTFAGTFDGQGYTISNLTASASGDNGVASAGLFGSITGVVQNVTLDNAKITSSHYAGGIAGYSSSNVGMAIKDCVVKNSTIVSAAELLANGNYDNGDKVGGIIGYMVAGDVVDGCTVENTTVQGYRDIGGIVGYGAGTITNNTVKNITLNVDKAHNYKNYTEDKQFDCNTVIGESAKNTVNENNTVDGEVQVVKKEIVATAEELKNILTNAGVANAGNTVITIEADITLSDAWTPVKIDGYNGAGVVTINGNGHTISGLTDTLLAGGFAGNSGIVINDLTIANANITSSNNQGYGAFINCVDSMPTITLNNCHLVDSVITDTLGARVGGLIGWSAGYNNPNDGPVDTYITIDNCSVTGCTITAAGSVGAIIGHAGNNPATYHTITNCVVENNKLTSNDDGYRVGAIVGTANVGEVTITDCTSEGNTYVQNDNGTLNQRPAGQSDLYGRFVPGTTGKLTIDGTAIN